MKADQHKTHTSVSDTHALDPFLSNRAFDKQGFQHCNTESHSKYC